MDDQEFRAWHAEMSDRMLEAKAEFERVSRSITATVEQIGETLDHIEKKPPPAPPEFVLVRGGRPDD